MADAKNDPKASGGHSDTPTPTGSMWKNTFEPVGSNTSSNGGAK